MIRALPLKAKHRWPQLLKSLTLTYNATKFMHPLGSLPFNRVWQDAQIASGYDVQVCIVGWPSDGLCFLCTAILGGTWLLQSGFPYCLSLQDLATIFSRHDCCWRTAHILYPTTFHDQYHDTDFQPTRGPHQWQKHFVWCPVEKNIQNMH